MIYLETGATDTDRPLVLFQNALANGSLVGSGTGGTDAQAVLGPQTFDYWTIGAGTGLLTVTLAVAAECDCIAIAAHNLGAVGASVRPYYSLTDVSGFIALGAARTPATDEALMIVFPATSGRRWQLQVVVPAGKTATIGIAMIGKRLVFPSSVQAPYVPAPAARKVELMVARSMGGHFIGNSVFRRGVEMQVSLNPVPIAFAETDLEAFRDHYDAGGTFFWAGAPAAMPRDLAYCWRAEGASELRPQRKPGGALAGINLELAGYGA